MALYSSNRCLHAGKFLSMEEEFGQPPGPGLLKGPGSTPLETLEEVEDVKSKSAPWSASREIWLSHLSLLLECLGGEERTS